MSGNRDTEADKGAGGDPAELLYDAVRRPHPWDLYRRSILEMAGEELGKGSAQAMIARLDRDLGTVWRGSPSALLAAGVALYRAGNEEETGKRLNEGWEIWEGLLDAEDPQTDSPLEILVLLRDLLRLTGLDEGSSIPTHFRVRPAYRWLCEEYRCWYEMGQQWVPSREGEDVLQSFCITCLSRAKQMKEHDQAPLTLDSWWAGDPP